MIFKLDKLIPETRTELDDSAMQAYETHYRRLLQTHGFTADGTNEAQISALANYFARYCGWLKHESSRPRKGLFLYGGCGTGKTLAMQILSGTFDIDFLPVWRLSKTFACEGAKAFWDMVDEHRNEDLILDDIANESAVKSFGNTFPLIDLLASRYEQKGLTFFTSNANGEAVIDLYGDYIYSRICGMCEPVKFTGMDHRRARRAEVQ